MFLDLIFGYYFLLRLVLRLLFFLPPLLLRVPFSTSFTRYVSGSVKTADHIFPLEFATVSPFALLTAVTASVGVAPLEAAYASASAFCLASFALNGV